MKTFFLIGLLIVVEAASLLAGSPLPTASPRRLGFDPDRFERMHRGIQSYIDQGKHAGAIAVIARKGKIADFTTYGYRDIEAKAPMTADTIVRIYSMSKVITSAAVLQLIEEGRIN